MLEASEKFLVSGESQLASELIASVQDVITHETGAAPASPLYVERRTVAPHGLTGAEIKRLNGATHCMVRQRRQIWFATVGDGLQDIEPAEARVIVDALLKAIVIEQKRHGLPQSWIVVWECTGGLHAHIIFISKKALIEGLKRSERFGAYLHVRWAYDPSGLSGYLSKERTPQAEYALGASIGGGRKPGSHRLPGGGDRVRLSAALRSYGEAAGYIEPWQRTNAKRKETRATSRPYRIRSGKAPRPAGQVLLFPELEKPLARLRDYHGGHMTPAQSREAEFRRQRLGLSQSQLAQIIGLSQPHYANVVRMHDSMSKFAARSLREALLDEPVARTAAA